MTKQLPHKKMSATTTMAVVALVIASVSFVWVWKINEDLRLGGDIDMKNEMQHMNRNARFEFCFNQNIRPCDDISIKEFNDKHEEDEQFNL